jgi:cobalt/nickel transport system permease protein
MHMADALVSPPVAITAGVAAAALIVVASRKVSQIKREDILPLMGVMGAFVFAAQMINFSIPGTGSSGHIIGGVLLAALMGPWAAFITLASVLIIQCLVFADGGLMALGCNLINMGAMSCLVAFPLIYRPIAGRSLKKGRVMLASIAACIVGLELGALLVTGETELSGITALPASQFLMFMLPIHLAIGLCEGVATGAVLCFVQSYKPDMLYRTDRLYENPSQPKKMTRKSKVVLTVFAVLALAMGVAFTWIASSNPDGLEWSIARITGDTELAPAITPATALMPDYNSTFSGVLGGLIVVALLWGFCSIIFRKRHAKA